LQRWDEGRERGGKKLRKREREEKKIRVCKIAIESHDVSWREREREKEKA